MRVSLPRTRAACHLRSCASLCREHWASVITWDPVLIVGAVAVNIVRFEVYPVLLMPASAVFRSLVYRWSPTAAPYRGFSGSTDGEGMVNSLQGCLGERRPGKAEGYL
jgi:hypothetical protein